MADERDGRYFDDDPTDRPKTTRKKRARMGAIVQSMGGSAVAAAGLSGLRRELVTREQAEKSNVLKGGRSKGEELGFGATSGKKAP